MQLTTWQAYDEAAQRYFDSYECISFSAVHRAFLRFIPVKGAKCLDVGAGSGRDAVALARRGLEVTAVEPSQCLRTLAEQRYPHPHIRWIDDHLPKLPRVVALHERYSFILVSAVLMHISPCERIQALNTLAQMLEIDGCIALTVRIGEPCVDRVMYPISVEEVLTYARHVELKPIYVGRTNRDSLRRSQVVWRRVVLVARPERVGHANPRRI